MGKNLIDDRYELRGLVGSGGMADVYLAHDNILDRDVAIKLLKERYAENEEFVERFRREARSAASLSHPHIVPVFAQGRSEDGTYYIAMEYLPGGTLKDRIMGEGMLAPRTVVEVAIQITEALQAAHERGVIHRDIKPRNILITDSGHVKVADFGIARAAEATTISNLGDILGSAKYMSPEQAAGERVGAASDLYSLGVVLYEMLTGKVPFEVETPADVHVKHAAGPPPHPREMNPKVPEDIDAFVMRLLATDPDVRYGSAEQLSKDLRRLRDSLSPVDLLGDDATTAALGTPALETPAVSTVAAPLPNDMRMSSRRTWFPIVAAFTLLALLSAVGWSLWQDHDPWTIVFPAVLVIAFAVALWAFAVLLWDLFEGRIRRWLCVVLVVVLAPVCALATLAGAAAATLAVQTALESGGAPVEVSEPPAPAEPTQPETTSDKGTSPETTTDRTASPSATPTSSPSATPSATASPSAAPSATPSATPSPSASPSP
jgi:serine/threonine protein kinase